MLSAEVIAVIASLFTALGVKEWWQGRAAKNSGLAQLEREQISLIIQNSKEAEERYDKCLNDREIDRREYIKTIKKLQAELLVEIEYNATLINTIVSLNGSIPPRRSQCD